MHQLVQAVRERTPLPAAGTDLQRRSMGFVWKPGAAAGRHPLQIILSGERLLVLPGTVGGLYPTLSGVSLATWPRPAFNVASNVTTYVVLRVQAQLNSDSGYVHSATVQSVQVELTAFEPLPSDLLSTGTFTIHLGRFVGGVLVAQNWTSSLSLGFCDSSNPEEARATLTVIGATGFSENLDF